MKILAELTKKTVAAVSSGTKTVADITHKSVAKLVAVSLSTKALIETKNTLASIVTNSRTLLDSITVKTTKLQVDIGVFFKLVVLDLYLDIASFSESLKIVFGKTVSDQTNLSDSKSISLSKASVDYYNVSDSANISYAKVLQDTTNFAEQYVITFSKAAADQTNIGENFGISSTKAVAEQLNFSESLVTLYNKNPSDQFNISDARIFNLDKAIAEQNNFSDAFSNGFYKNISDAVNFTDDVNGAAIDDDQLISFFKASSDQVNILEQVSFDTSKPITDQTNVLDTGLVFLQDYAINSPEYFLEDYVGSTSLTFT